MAVVQKKQMGSSELITVALFVLLGCCCSFTSSTDGGFSQCFMDHFSTQSNMSEILHIPNTSSYRNDLELSIKNLRFSTSTTPKPLLIIVVRDETHVQASVICCKRLGLELRVMSGGHSYEGLSYVSPNPFVLLNLINYSSVNVDMETNSAWVQAGATAGELYYRIAERSPVLAAVGPLCPSVGMGGSIGGGVIGTMMRKYGLGADNTIDAKLVTADGVILNRKSMGEELFWAIRGGGVATYGVALSWQVKLVAVPRVVTVFTVTRTLEQDAAKVAHRWQYMGEKCDCNLFIRVIFQATEVNGTRTVEAAFNSLFLGRCAALLKVMKDCFPELGLVEDDCHEMSWIESVVYIGGYPPHSPIEVLLNRKSPMGTYPFKAKSDFVNEPISEQALREILDLFMDASSGLMLWEPLGGMMDQISPSATPFPHRRGTLYNIQYVSILSDRYEDRILWINELYNRMAPYASASPRMAYLNYIDLDIGVNQKNSTTYRTAIPWGTRYFKSNFRKLALIKAKTDPQSFFWYEQSIPPLSSSPRSP